MRAMHFWRRLGLAVAAFALLPIGGQAATLTMSFDKSVYSLGETITLTVTGDAQGASSTQVYGRVLSDAGLVGSLDSAQSQLTSFSGAIPWTTAPLNRGPGFNEAFNQLS